MDIKTIQNAMKLYYTKKGKYPDTGTGLRALVDTQNLEKIPVDPWGHEYIYMNESGKPVVISYGADGSQGGEGPDADISSRDTTAQK
jgi:general secretion pathway protein G